MSLYRIQALDEILFVEAESFTEAIEVFQAWWKNQDPDDEYPDEMESVELVNNEEVVRSPHALPTAAREVFEELTRLVHAYVLAHMTESSEPVRREILAALSAQAAQATCVLFPSDGGDSAVPRVTGVQRIALERQRQISVEGWTPEHDDEHDAGSLAHAAVCYARETVSPTPAKAGCPIDWPWSSDWWKPGDRIRNLEKAGALIAAEIDRLHRETP